MTDGPAILRSVLERPADDSPRLIYADWLDDQGGKEPVARAAFIRAQIALARNPPMPTCIPKGSEFFSGLSKYTHHCRCAYCKLRRSEWNAWRHHACDWQGDFYRVIAEWNLWRPRRDTLSTPESCDFARGFIESVTMPLATFVGGRCEPCGGTGDRYRHFATTDAACHGCGGRGTAPGVAKRLAETCPIVAVTLSDREPGEYTAADGLVYGWGGGRRETDGPDNRPSFLPPELWEEVAKTAPNKPIENGSYWADFPSRAAAVDALSLAACRYGRKLAGLPDVGA